VEKLRVTAQPLRRAGTISSGRVADLRDLDPRPARASLTVVGERIIHELRGRSCLPTEIPTIHAARSASSERSHTPPSSGIDLAMWLAVYRQFARDVEVYSIDESFLDLSDVRERDRIALARPRPSPSSGIDLAMWLASLARVLVGPIPTQVGRPGMAT
jgi:hypothetical protein